MKKIKEDERNWDEIRFASRGYCGKLTGAINRIDEELDAEAKLFKEGNNRGSILIFGHEISLKEFTLLLIIREDFRISEVDGWRRAESERLKKEIFKVQDFIKKVPGMRLPEIPKILAEWLES